MLSLLECTWTVLTICNYCSATRCDEDWREEDVNLSAPGAVEPDDFIMGVIELVTTFVFFFALPGIEAVC